MKDRMVLGEAKDSATAVAAMFEVQSYPTLVVIKEDGTKVLYQGKLSFPTLMDFLKQHALLPADEINHYQVLGVAQDASDEQIKKAYRKLSLKYHPDKNSGDSKAQKMFEQIGAAYELLADDNKRAVYDQELNIAATILKMNKMVPSED